MCPFEIHYVLFLSVWLSCPLHLFIASWSHFSHFLSFVLIIYLCLFFFSPLCLLSDFSVSHVNDYPLSPSLSLSLPIPLSLPLSLPLSAAFVSRPLAISLSLLLWKQHCSMGAQMNVHFVCVSEVTDRKYSSRVKTSTCLSSNERKSGYAARPF